MSVATQAGSVCRQGVAEVHLAAKGIVRIISLCLDGRGMTRCRLTLLGSLCEIGAFARIHANRTRQSATMPDDRLACIT